MMYKNDKLIGLKVDKKYLEANSAMNGGNKLNIDNKELDEIHAAMMKEITKETGMNKCPVCDSEDVVNFLEKNLDNVDEGSYIVKHFCNSCEKGYKMSITIGQKQIMKALLTSTLREQYVMYLFYLVLQQAREQIEKFVRHQSETEKVIEK